MTAGWPKGLFRETRYDHANEGLPIDHPSGPRGRISLAAMVSTSYGDNGADAGFCANLDGDLHGAVHVNVGNSEGMGDVPWAASDPIFWLHHCNIDRVWASWIKAGGKNPATEKFLGESFTFADTAGKSVKVTVNDMLDHMEPTYDSYLDRPPGAPDFLQPSPLSVAQMLRFEGTKSVKLNGKAAEVIRLGPPKGGLGGGPLPVAGQAIKQVPKEAKLHLRLEGLTAPGPVQGFFDIHVGSVVDSKTNRQSASYLGSLNFFGATHVHGSGIHSTAGKKMSLLVPPQARDLLETQGQNVQVIFVPVGRVGGAQPTIGKVALVAR